VYFSWVIAMARNLSYEQNFWGMCTTPFMYWCSGWWITSLVTQICIFVVPTHCLGSHALGHPCLRMGMLFVRRHQMQASVEPQERGNADRLESKVSMVDRHRHVDTDHLKPSSIVEVRPRADGKFQGGNAVELIVVDMQSVLSAHDVKVEFGSISAQVVGVFTGLKAGRRMTRITVRVPPAESVGAVEVHVRSLARLKVPNRPPILEHAIWSYDRGGYEYTLDGMPVQQANQPEKSALELHAEKIFADPNFGKPKATFDFDWTSMCAQPRGGGRKTETCRVPDALPACEVPDALHPVGVAVVEAHGVVNRDFCDNRC